MLRSGAVAALFCLESELTQLGRNLRFQSRPKKVAALMMSYKNQTQYTVSLQ